MARAQGSFFEGVEALKRRVGDGKLVGRVVVDQPYAAPQHEGVWHTGPNAGVRIKEHPKGGGPPPSKFLETPVKDRAAEFGQRLASNVLNGRLPEEMAAITDDLVGEVAKRAPLDDGVLRGSGQSFVTDGQRLSHHTPPRFPRVASGADL